MCSKCTKHMDHGNNMSNKEDAPPSINHVTPTREHSHKQLTLGRQILESTSGHNWHTNSLLNLAMRLYKSKEHVGVHLKYGNGTVIGRGILDTQIQVSDNIGGLRLFIHQCALRILKVHTTRHANTNMVNRWILHWANYSTVKRLNLSDWRLQ